MSAPRTDPGEQLQDDFLAEAFPSDSELSCPGCQSELIRQIDPDNKNHEAAEFLCRACGQQFEACTMVEHALEMRFEVESFIAAQDGAPEPLGSCPECGFSTYVMESEHVGCAWCGFVLGHCKVCDEYLTPDNASVYDYNICDYCRYNLTKDD